MYRADSTVSTTAIVAMKSFQERRTVPTTEATSPTASTSRWLEAMKLVIQVSPVLTTEAIAPRVIFHASDSPPTDWIHKAVAAAAAVRATVMGEMEVTRPAKSRKNRMAGP